MTEPTNPSDIQLKSVIHAQFIVPLAYDVMIRRFRPLVNHNNDSASFLYETYGDDMAFIAKQPSSRVWTVVEEDGELLALSGIHFVNRIAYFITEEPWPADVLYEVPFG